MECLLRNGCRLLGLALALAASGAAVAADNGFYLGGSAADVSSDYGVPVSAAGEPRDDDGFKLIGGVRPLDKFAIEANYVDLGTTRVALNVVCVTTPCPNESAIESRALSVSAVGLFTLPLLDIYGRVGVARWESEQSIGFTLKGEGTDPTYGAGIQLRLGSFALRVEYERFEFGDDAADLRSVGFTYTFL
jgi:hypothetical protein